MRARTSCRHPMPICIRHENGAPLSHLDTPGPRPNTARCNNKKNRAFARSARVVGRASSLPGERTLASKFCSCFGCKNVLRSDPGLYGLAGRVGGAGVALPLLCCYSAVTLLLLCCYSAVTLLLLCCYSAYRGSPGTARVASLCAPHHPVWYVDCSPCRVPGADAAEVRRQEGYRGRVWRLRQGWSGRRAWAWPNSSPRGI